jgi:tRNA threonylcarbamoyladenosine biosynthesis protein TsaB
MSAKALAYAAGCALVAVDTFAALARQAPPGTGRIDVIADAQQDKLYVQRFTVEGAGPLAIAPLADWAATLTADAWVVGPGLETFADRLPAGTRFTDRADWYPRVESLLAVGLERWRRGERDDPFAVEPLYLRPSSAEEKWAQRT